MSPSHRGAPSDLVPPKLEDRLRAAILDAAELLVVVLDPEGRIVRFNSVCERTSGFRAEEVLGRPVWELIPERDRPGARAAFVELRDSARANVHENDWRTRGGELRHVAWSNTAVRSDDGQVALVIGTGIDVTDLRLSEEARRESQARFRGIVDSAMDAIVSVDESQRIALFNPAAERIFGRRADDVVGEPLDVLLPARFRTAHRGHVERFGKTNQTNRRMGRLGHVWGVRASGEEFPLEASISQVETEDGRLLTVILRDVSERERAARRLREAQELASLGTLVAGLAHDIGTPLNVVLGYADLLERSVQKDQNKERIHTIREQVKRVAKLIQSLLNLARPHEAVRAPVALEPLLEESLGFLGETLRSRGIAVERSFRGVGAVRGDPERLERAFLNLLLNAADAMRAGGTLGLSTRPLGEDAVEVRVRDTGGGIPRELHERVFEPFYTTKPPGQGNGLGLLVARSTFVDHGGSIELESELGKGTEFRVLLPRDGTPEPHHPASP